MQKVLKILFDIILLIACPKACWCGVCPSSAKLFGISFFTSIVRISRKFHCKCGNEVEGLQDRLAR